MKLSVIILNYNVRPFLELCLHSVSRAVDGLDAEIIVVDNNSEDDSREMVKSVFPGVRLIHNAENYGFARGNNIGVSYAKGDYICILNPDTVVPETLFSEMLNFAESRENLGALGCRLIDGSGRFLPESKRNVPTVRVALRKLTGSAKGYYSDHIKETETAAVDILVGAIMLMKTSVYNEIGGFDEQYFMYGEDVDMSFTLLKKGYVNWYFGSNRLLHFKGESTLKNLDYLKRFYGAMYIFYKKHFKPNLLFNTVAKLGLLFMSVFKRNREVDHADPDSGIYLGGELPERLAEVRKIAYSHLEELPSETEGKEVVFDASEIEFDKILAIMESHSESRDILFMIRPPGGNFMLGSRDADSLGQVIFWD